MTFFNFKEAVYNTILDQFPALFFSYAPAFVLFLDLIAKFKLFLNEIKKMQLPTLFKISPELLISKLTKNMKLIKNQQYLHLMLF